MTRADDTILEFLLNEGNRKLRQTPSNIEMNIEFSDSTVRTRIRILHDEELVEYWNKDRSAYQITEKGERYLKGELDADELEREDVSD